MQTIDVTPEAMEARVVRFDAVRPSSRSSRERHVPAVVTELLIPRALYPIMGPEGSDSPVFNFAMHGPDGVSMTVCEVDPGDGPALHAHHTTDEVFFVLQGRFRIEWGDRGEHAVELERFDTIAVPPRVVRRFENIGVETGYLLALVCGGAESITEVEYTPDVGAQVSERGGADVRALLEAAGVGFAAGER
ncbi:MAG: cupin domain-containing protein [Acidimicrobiales bacterium]